MLNPSIILGVQDTIYFDGSWGNKNNRLQNNCGNNAAKNARRMMLLVLSKPMFCLSREEGCEYGLSTPFGVIKAKVCVGLFVYLYYRIEESWVPHLVLNSLKAPPGRTNTTQASTSVVHRRDNTRHKWEEGVNGPWREARSPLEALCCLVTQWMLWWFQCQVCARPATGSWCEQLNMNCCPKLQKLKRGGWWGHSQELCCGTWDKAGSFGYPLPGSTSAPGASCVPTFAFLEKATWQSINSTSAHSLLHSQVLL